MEVRSVRFPRPILNQKLCLLLFAAGVAISVAADLLGISAVTVEPVFGKQIIPVDPVILTACIYAAGGIITGIMTKRRGNAPFYGASLGQCQFLLPAIMYMITGSGEPMDIVWRTLCGIPLTAAAAFISFTIKRLIRK